MAGTTINPYRFGGQLGYRQDGANRNHVRARNLDASRGRWLSRDPAITIPQPVSSIASDNFNFYWYAKNSPTFATDPSGLQDFPGGGIGGGIPFDPDPPILPPDFPFNPINACVAVAKCTNCSLAIAASYVYLFGKIPRRYTWQHACNHLYAHCMACCVLTRYVNDTCAWLSQNAEIGYKPINNNSGRIQGCSAGVTGASSSGSCDTYCQGVFPFTTVGKPPVSGLPDGSGHTCGSHAKTLRPGFGPLTLCGGIR